MDVSTRDRLIAAAAERLDRGGPAAVTLREVGRAAGVSHTAPYRHFADKDDLLAAVASRELDANFGADGRDLRTLALDHVRWARRHPERFRLTFGGWRREHPDLSEAAGKAHARLLDAVRSAQIERELPDGHPDRFAALVHAMAHGAADLAIAGHLGPDGKGGVEAESLVGDLLDVLAESAGLSLPSGPATDTGPK